MDGVEFDKAVRTMTKSRRSLLVGVLGAAAGWAGVSFVSAKKKRHRKRKKVKTPKPNAYGCLDVGQPCNGDSALCCSGICEGTAPKKGKKDTSRCAAHDAAICRGPDSDICTTGVGHYCNGNNLGCACLLTTGHGGFCGGPGAECRVCRRDADCQEEFGSGAACVVREGICAGQCPDTGGTLCVPPCPTA